MTKNSENLSRWWLELTKWRRGAIRIALSIFSALFIFEGLHVLAHGDEFSSHILVIAFGFIVTMLFSFLLTNAMRFAISTKDANEQLKKMNETLKEVAMKDSLTGLWSNRDFLLDTIRRMCSRGKRNGELLVILFIDGDDFGDINKRYGHVAGDNAIKVMSKIISHCLREDDFLFRYGGDEFLALLLLKKIPPKEMRMELDVLKERIHSHFENVSFFHENSRIPISVSIGEHFINMDSLEFKQEIELGSQKMNEEKKRKRNNNKATAE